MKKFNLMAYLLPPEEKKFYELFEKSTETCKEAAELFNEIVNSSLNEEHLIRAKTLKHKSIDLLKQTLWEINQTFVTPIEPEDIQLIATLLNKITKKITKVCFDLRVYRLEKITPNMIKQSETILTAADELTNMIKNFKKASSIKKITGGNLRMKEIESHGDEILYVALDELFSGKYEALEVIKLKDIYKDLETALDSYFAISDEIVNIVLKQS